MSQFDSSGTQAASLYQLSVWSAANLAGMVNDHLAARQPFFKRLMKKIAPNGAKAIFKGRRPSNQESLPLLADAVVGSSRTTIFAVFGPPGGVAVTAPPEEPGSAVWEAGTWYYSLPQNGSMAMAVNFDDDYAHCVEFFQMPE
ncbi:MAG TPA: hypothetical protein VFE47_08830 [Tepidisphaeraceae bacterium]|jgi:hypothetical protein|nr:hypothetical protein [Tepidisphaeraceae bacterium]